MTFAVATTPCVRNESLTLRFIGASQLTSYWLSAAVSNCLPLFARLLFVRPCPPHDVLRNSAPTICQGRNPSADMISLNGENLTVSVSAPLPSLTGAASRGDSVTLPAGDVCVAGFVEAVYAEPVMACM